MSLVHYCLVLFPNYYVHLANVHNVSKDDIITFVSHYPPPLSTSALTVENILTAVQGVPWRSLGARIFPPGMCDEIERQHHSHDDRLCVVVQRFLQGDGVDNEPSWRRIIWALDSANETRTANSIRHFAEPLPGKSRDSITFLYSVQVLPHIR